MCNLYPETILFETMTQINQGKKGICFLLKIRKNCSGTCLLWLVEFEKKISLLDPQRGFRPKKMVCEQGLPPWSLKTNAPATQGKLQTFWNLLFQAVCCKKVSERAFWVRAVNPEKIVVFLLSRTEKCFFLLTTTNEMFLQSRVFLLASMWKQNKGEVENGKKIQKSINVIPHRVRRLPFLYGFVDIKNDFLW